MAEKHLPQEAWRIVQRAQGRVKPATQMEGAPVNDDAGLEAEADAMGAKAMQQASEGVPRRPDPCCPPCAAAIGAQSSGKGVMHDRLRYRAHIAAMIREEP